MHINRKHNSAEKTHVCKTCNKSFIDVELLQNHVYQSHNKQTCPECNKTIFNSSQLRRHLVFEHGIEEDAWICEICPKVVFFAEYYYKKHMADKHATNIDEDSD